MKNLRKTALRRMARSLRSAQKLRQSEKGEAPLAEAPPAGDETPVPGGQGGEAPATPEAVPEAKAVVKVEPPASPERVSEAPEAALWPEAGVKVAVGVEHLAHSLRVGETGVSEGPCPDDARQVIVRLDSAAVLSSMTVPRSVLVPIGAPMSNLRLWDKCSESVKRDLLMKLGVGDPRDEVLPSSAPVSLTMWGEYVGIGLRLGEQRPYKFVSPFFVKAFEDGFDLMQKAEEGEFALNFAELEDETLAQDVRQRLLQEWWAQHEVLLVCLCDEASGSSGLLALRKTPVSVRFYEVSGGKALGEVGASRLASGTEGLVSTSRWDSGGGLVSTSRLGSSYQPSLLVETSPILRILFACRD